MNTISYKEIVRKVHPDLNPHIQDAGAKMAEIQRNKNNPSALFSLAVRWGLVEGHTSSNFSGFGTSSTTNHRTRDTYWTTDFSADSSGNVYINVDDEVSFRTRRGRGRGIQFGKVKKVDTVKSGSRKGWYRFYIATPFQVFIVKKPSKESDATLAKGSCLGPVQAEHVEKTWDSWVATNQRRKEEKEERRQRKAENNKEDLGTNRNYRGQGVWVFVRTKSNWFRVTRTTAKSVFYHDYFEGKERRCQFSSVSRVWKE